MVELKWNTFRAKFEGRERSQFEALAYQLFCNEFGVSKGIFRFKNQIGIETEPIIVAGQQVGFQAKYIETSISLAKADIVDSIQKAKTKNSGLSRILFFINQEFSESSDPNIKDPVYKSDIEKIAADLQLIIEWRVPSHFERQLASPENHYLAEYYFSLGKNSVDFLRELSAHAESLFHVISSEIRYGASRIKIDRTANKEELLNSATASKTFLLYG
jgi:hypothetical protein